MGHSGAGRKLIDEKNQKQKISWHCPFKRWSGTGKKRFGALLVCHESWTMNIEGTGTGTVVRISSVLWIRDICMDANPDPYHWLTDPDPALFVSDLQDANKHFFFLVILAYHFLKVNLHRRIRIRIRIRANKDESGRSKNIRIRIQIHNTGSNFWLVFRYVSTTGFTTDFGEPEISNMDISSFVMFCVQVSKSPFFQDLLHFYLHAVLRIHDFLVWIQSTRRDIQRPTLVE